MGCSDSNEEEFVENLLGFFHPHSNQRQELLQGFLLDEINKSEGTLLATSKNSFITVADKIEMIHRLSFAEIRLLRNSCHGIYTVRDSVIWMISSNHVSLCSQ